MARSIRFLVVFLVTLSLVLISDRHNPFGSTLPRLGAFLSPFEGFWQNAEASKMPAAGTLSIPGLRGQVRVVMDERGIKDVKEGEILVAPTTASPWTPVFSIVKGVVTDHGGILAHAAIVSREYGIPSVVGTHEATHKIKPGMRIRVDGDNCAVWILD